MQSDKDPGAMPTPDATLRDQYFSGLSDEDMGHVTNFCEKRGLDPWARQVYAQSRWDGEAKCRRLFIMVTIDGMRAQAAKTREYAGNDAAVFSYESAAAHPDRARATVHRIVGGTVRPYTGEARFDEYYPAGGDTRMWDKMPCAMLGKCAEAVALRKAFPELAGLYTPDEMSRAMTDWSDAELREARPEAPRSLKASAESLASVDGEPPQTQRQLLLKMIDAEIPPRRRNDVIARFRALWPGLLERDAAAFARKAWAAICAAPAEYGVPAAEASR